MQKVQEERLKHIHKLQTRISQLHKHSQELSKELSSLLLSRPPPPSGNLKRKSLAKQIAVPGPPDDSSGYSLAAWHLHTQPSPLNVPLQTARKLVLTRDWEVFSSI